QQYTLGYYPTNKAKDGGFRQIKIEIADKSLRVRTKRGYYAQEVSGARLTTDGNKFTASN
ncbi:MAG: hypothetical protein MSG64_21085, partial [Pyrinomonadaceae bacterium MAG19_C2-C3]|nr:hypothetical protein [Pyrinomonadaceae bacterium MAG19_C2-C3]